MMNSNAILQIYSSVLREDIKKSKIPEKDIRLGVQTMAHAYAPESTNFSSDISDRKFTDYNIPGFRIAYLHKFAPLHTYIVLDVMTKMLYAEINLFKTVLSSEHFKLCCLGGGPGSDAVGVLAALHTVFNSFRSSVTIIDSMEQWKHTFGLVISKLYVEGFGMHWNSLQWNYIGADLLNVGNVPAAVSNAVNSASFITMVKFISAAACSDTEPMVEKIFQMMKPGALLLFIDNAAGGFTQLIERAGKKSNFQIIAGPFKHMEYSNEDLKVERFGYTSCFQTKVTIILMKKPDNIRNKASHPSSYGQGVPAKKVPLRDVQNINKVPSQTHINTQEKMNSASQQYKKSSDVQNAKKTQRHTAIKEKTNKPLLSIKIETPLQPEPTNQSVPGVKRKAHLLPSVPNVDVVPSKRHETARDKFNTSLQRNNSTRSSTSRLIPNENPIRPSSYAHAVKVNHLNHQHERFHPQSVGSSYASPDSVRISQPYIIPSSEPYIIPCSEPYYRVPSSDEDSSGDSCCSCCTVS